MGSKSKRSGIGAKDWGYEVSLDGLSNRSQSRLMAGDIHSDPTMEAVCAEQDIALAETDDELWFAIERAENASMVVNLFWWMGDFYGSQWVIRKRRQDREHYKHIVAVRDKRKARSEAKGCSALQSDSKRSRCVNEAVYVRAQKTKAGNWSYQRRCVGCFAKVKDKAKYKPINDGLFFRPRSSIGQSK